jgi:hypothetical protein
MQKYINYIYIYIYIYEEMACSLFFASLQDIQKEMEENGKVQRCFDCCWTVVGLVWCSETNCVQTCLLLLDSVGPQGFVDPVSEQRWWWLEGGIWIWEDALFPS